MNADDSLYFSHAQTKLLPAEVLLDAISTVTGTTTSFDGLPKGARATQIPDGKMENPFLKTFGRPARELACECERESDSNLSQALQLIGGATVNGKLRDDNGRMAQLAKSGKSPEQVTRELYMVALSRDPSPTELAAAVKHLTVGQGPPPGRRGPGLGADQFQGIPVPPLRRRARRMAQVVDADRPERVDSLLDQVSVDRHDFVPSQKPVEVLLERTRIVHEDYKESQPHAVGPSGTPDFSRNQGDTPCTPVSCRSHPHRSAIRLRHLRSLLRRRSLRASARWLRSTCLMPPPA